MAESEFYAQFGGGGGGGGGGISELEVGVTPIVGGSVGRLLLEGTGNVLQESPELFWDFSNDRLGIRTDTPECTLDIRTTGTSNTRGVQVRHYDNTNAFSQAKYIGARARGTQNSPSAVQQNDSLASFNGRGYKTSDWSNTVGGFYIYANQNWTDAATGTYMTWRGVVDGGTTVSEWMRLSQGKLGINNTNPQALIDINANTATATDKSFQVNDSSNVSVFVVGNTGIANFTTWGNNLITGNKTIQVTGTNTGTQLSIQTGASPNTSTSTEVNQLWLTSAGFAPTSGTAVYNQFRVSTTINQTGGANGITRGVYINPTLTAAADWRGIEVTNNTGWGVYVSGTANNYMAGSLALGRTTVGAKLDIQAQGALSTDLALRVRNSADTANLATIDGLGTLRIIPAANTTAISSTSYSLTGSNAQSLIDVSGTWNTTGTPTLIKANVTNTASNASSLLMDLQVGGASQFQVTRAGQVGVAGTSAYVGRSATFTGGGGGLIASFVTSVSTSATSGISNGFSSNNAFNPTSGTATFSGFSLTATINQTGGANGITRGVYINPTLTAAADWRGIEVTNNTGWGVYVSGTANNYMAGSLALGRTTVGAKLDIQAQGALSTDLALRVRNSADSDNIIAIQGNNQIVKGASTIIVPNVQSVTSAATVTPTSGNDTVVITAQAEALTLANPTGTWVQGLPLMIRIKDNGTSRAITYGNKYRAIGVTLPPSTTATKTTYLGVIYNSTDDTFDVIGVSTQA